MTWWLRLFPAPLVRFFARPYVAGDSLSAALDTAASLADQGLCCTIDLLAEEVASEEAAKANLHHYLALCDQIAARFAPEVMPTVSLKPSNFTHAPLDRGGDAAGSAEAVLALVQHAASLGVRLTLDMESSAWTDFTLELLERAHAQGPKGAAGLGAVLQSRLLRTERDVERLPAGCRVRLVTGIYRESANIAVTDKPTMKARLLVLAERLRERGHYVELATHDENVIRRFVDDALAHDRSNAPLPGFEIQMLYGVPRQEMQRALVSQGVTTRIYVPYALGWPMAIAYLRRRLQEYPAMMFLVLRDRLLRAR